MLELFNFSNVKTCTAVVARIEDLCTPDWKIATSKTRESRAT
jgi:hypothetical protein